MHISNINSTNFKSIYRDFNMPLSESQHTAYNTVTKTLQQPHLMYDNQSASNFYKSKYNVDFFVSQGKENSIILEGMKNLKINDKDIEYDYKFVIGRYDNDNPLSLNDIEKPRLEAVKQDRLWTTLFIIIGLCILSITLGGKLPKFKTQKPAPKVENTEKLTYLAQKTFNNAIKF